MPKAAICVRNHTSETTRKPDERRASSVEAAGRARTSEMCTTISLRSCSFSPVDNHFALSKLSSRQNRTTTKKDAGDAAEQEYPIPGGQPSKSTKMR